MALRANLRNSSLPAPTLHPLISRTQHNLDDLVATPARDGIEAAGFTGGVLDRPSLVAALAAAIERFMQIDVLEYSPAAHEPNSDLARVDVTHMTVRTSSPRSSTTFMMRPTGSRTSSAVKNAFCNPGSVPWAANTDTGNRWLSAGDRPQTHPAIAAVDVSSMLNRPKAPAGSLLPGDSLTIPATHLATHGQQEALSQWERASDLLRRW